MKENVGSLDRTSRSIIGPLLIFLGYSRLGGRRGEPLGLLAMAAGLATIESAITRVCPLNRLLGIDSRSPREIARDRQRAQIQ
jgi:hypothetical protein